MRLPWLRAVEHRLANNANATLTPQQLAGWHALQSMISRQAESVNITPNPE